MNLIAFQLMPYEIKADLTFFQAYGPSVLALLFQRSRAKTPAKRIRRVEFFVLF